MKIKSVFIFAIIMISGFSLMSDGNINYASTKYATNTQSLANNNECDNGANCANPSSQSIGDGTASSPVNTQVSRFNGVDGVGEDPPQKETEINLNLCAQSSETIRCYTFSSAPAMLECFEIQSPVVCMYQTEQIKTAAFCESLPQPGPMSQTANCRFYY